MAETEGTWTVRRLLEWTTSFFTRKGMDQSRLCAEQLLSHVLQYPRIKLYTDYERVVAPAQLAAYRDLVKRAADEEPIAYLTGRAHFFSMEFEVNKDVLIPRPDTETLVENVIQLMRNEAGMETPRILDLCTGSGCIAAAIARNLKTATVIATDISPAALAVAKSNIERLNLSDRVTLKLGDLFGPLDREPFHVIVSNPPYIPSGQIAGLDKSVRDFEPVSALDGGLDGLTIHRRILADAPERLVANGQIFVEIAFDQGELAKSVIAEHRAFTNVRILKDNAGNDRVLAARKA
jgi:release factor glutamine methyltransferase